MSEMKLEAAGITTVAHLEGIADLLGVTAEEFIRRAFSQRDQQARPSPSRTPQQ